MTVPLLNDLIRAAAVLIEFGGNIVVVVGCLRGFLALVRGRDHPAGILRARLLVANGVIVALGYKTAATLLKTIELQSWNAILMFASILTLRTLIKRALAWEESRYRA